MLKVEEKEVQQFSLFINKISDILLSTLMMLLQEEFPYLWKVLNNISVDKD